LVPNLSFNLKIGPGAVQVPVAQSAEGGGALRPCLQASSCRRGSLPNPALLRLPTGPLVAAPVRTVRKRRLRPRLHVAFLVSKRACPSSHECVSLPGGADIVVFLARLSERARCAKRCCPHAAATGHQASVSTAQKRNAVRCEPRMNLAILRLPKQRRATASV
jgi:hypothetical protein